MMKNILITGCSSGFGLALCKYYLEKGYKVYGISRGKPKIDNTNFIFKSFDLSDANGIKEGLTQFIQDIQNLEIVYLNAGILGKIQSAFDTTIDALQEVYQLNVYANKELLDLLSTITVNTVIGISSGAVKNGSIGWAGYSLSKAGLNMLINLYAKEMPNTKLLAVAPGVIETPMTDIIRFGNLDEEKFPSVKRLKEGEIISPKQAVIRMDKLVSNIERFESGGFVDIREV
jgi:benzil reductase ((S)-benzoin forming)